MGRAASGAGIMQEVRAEGGAASDTAARPDEWEAVEQATRDLGPGWIALRTGGLVDHPYALLHPDVGIALVGTRPDADAVATLRGVLAEDEACRALHGAYLPLVYRPMPPAGLSLAEVVEAAFALEPRPDAALSRVGEPWTDGARRALTRVLPESQASADTASVPEERPPVFELVNVPLPELPPAQAPDGEAHATEPAVPEATVEGTGVPADTTAGGAPPEPAQAAATDVQPNARAASSAAPIMVAPARLVLAPPDLPPAPLPAPEKSRSGGGWVLLLAILVAVAGGAAWWWQTIKFEQSRAAQGQLIAPAQVQQER